MGVVGYSLTGGVGLQARKHGMQINQITAIELVNEFGETIRASEDVHPDLFWALRGGGGNFGVVTAMEFELVPTPQVNAGMLIWPWEDARPRCSSAGSRCCPELPEEFTTTCRLVQMPPFEEIPEFLRGRQLVDRQRRRTSATATLADKLLAPLRELNPEIDTFDDVDPSALAYLHMDPEDPMPYAADHMLLDDLDPSSRAASSSQRPAPAAVRRWRSSSCVTSAARSTRSAPGHGARTTLPGELLYFTIGALMPDLPPEVARRPGCEGARGRSSRTRPTQTT